MPGQVQAKVVRPGAQHSGAHQYKQLLGRLRQEDCKFRACRTERRGQGLTETFSSCKPLGIPGKRDRPSAMRTGGL